MLAYLFQRIALLVAAVAHQDVELGPWQVQLGTNPTIHAISVPGTIEDQIDPDFDGISSYQTQIVPVELSAEQRLLLRFEGAATSTRVYFGDTFIGEHLGAWTPFTVDATHAARNSLPGQPWNLRVEVDEKVGHNTQGFLPIVTHHFGGLWQPVSARITEGRHVLVENAIQIHWLDRERVKISVPVSGPASESFHWQFRFRNQPIGEEEVSWHRLKLLSSAWSASARATPWIQGAEPSGFHETVWEFELALPRPVSAWTPHHPQLYEFRVELLEGMPNTSAGGASTTDDTKILAAASITTGYRVIVTRDDKFILNGEPIVLRGVLNWGYSPPSVAPSLDEEWMRNEIEYARRRGFNLMKFCLWIPPRRYLELCDELGMLAWIEYPTWHPRLDGQHLEELRREYAEFFEYDRNHPSVILRSLTCETGPSAELAVIQSLYDLCKVYVPGALVVDDSSWISWNRVYDFFDDHPYGNNHTWVATLDKLRTYIAARETKPLMLGEAIAADSWTEPTAALLHYAESSAAHGPWSVADNLRWQQVVGELASRRGRWFDPTSLRSSSIQYGLLMRKYQVETYRREIPFGGYVVSVIRDFPKAAMGLIDFENQPKNSAVDWAFQREAMVIMASPNDRRAFVAGESVPLTFLTVTDGFGPSVGDIDLTVSWMPADRSESKTDALIRMAPRDAWRSEGKLDWVPPAVVLPTRWILRAEARCANGADARQSAIINEWPVWIFPQVSAPTAELPIQIHPSASGIARRIGLRVNPVIDAYSFDRIVLTQTLDRQLIDFLERGGKVFMIPDGRAGSFPVADHWFLRGAVVTLPRSPITPAQETFVHMINELQHFDLAGPVVPNIDHFLSRIDPIILLWDNHDRRDVLTHGLAFRMGVGQSGELLVTTLNLAGESNPAGVWLLHRWCQHLLQGPYDGFTADERIENLALLRAELERQVFPLHRERWRFRADRDVTGKDQGWHTEDCDDSHWESIRVDAHWEGQGYPDLDGWAWYRHRIRIPESWRSPQTYLNFTGIDDYADIYVNGELIGTAGDIDARQTAFDDRISLDISRFIHPGAEVQIAIAVYDWYGAGGIFRPVSLSTEPLDASPPLLK